MHNIRSQPECATATSVEECDGYEQAPPYTTFLKTLESEFRCSGFCWKPAPAAPVAAATTAAPAAASGTAPAAANGTTSLVNIRPHTNTVAHRRTHHMLSFLQEGAADAPASPFPQSLFSHTLAQASCEGMAARDMRNFAGDIGYQTFYQGIYLVVVAIITGFLKLIGACLARDSTSEQAKSTY